MTEPIDEDYLRESMGYRQKKVNEAEKQETKARVDTPRPVDIVLVTQEVIGSSPVNGKTGLVQKRLNELYKGRPLSIDSSKTAVRLMSWEDEADKSRLETLFHYGMCEAFNYNAAVQTEQINAQRQAMNSMEKNLYDSIRSKQSVLPLERETDQAVLAQDKLEIERPGYPGEIIDIRAIASKVHLTASSTTDRWRQMARAILDETLPKEVQCVYSAATKASMYFALPVEFIDGIVQCCAISSDLSDKDTVSMNTINSHVRTSLGFKLNEIKKGRSKDIEVLVRDAVSVGWTPPGVTRDEACMMYGVGTSGEVQTGQILPHPDEEDIFKEEEEDWNEPMAPAIIAKPTPTSHLKRRGPCGIKYSEGKKARPFSHDNEESSVGTLREAMRTPTQSDLTLPRRVEDPPYTPPASYYNLRH